MYTTLADGVDAVIPTFEDIFESELKEHVVAASNYNSNKHQNIVGDSSHGLP